MNWWGKLIGTGVGMFGGPIGALAGAALGHLYDDDDSTPLNEQKARILYLAYFFPVLLKLLKLMVKYRQQKYPLLNYLYPAFA